MNLSILDNQGPTVFRQMLCICIVVSKHSLQCMHQILWGLVCFVLTGLARQNCSSYNGIQQPKISYSIHILSNTWILCTFFKVLLVAKTSLCLCNPCYTHEKFCVGVYNIIIKMYVFLLGGICVKIHLVLSRTFFF